MPFLSASWISGSLVTLFVRRSVVWTCSASPSVKRQNLNWKSVQRITTSSMAKAKGFPKPPNVLIYTGNGSQGLEKYKEVRNVLLAILNRDSYVTYRLDSEKALTHPWSENAALLVIATNNRTLEERIQERFTTFVTNGGKILSLCTRFCPQPHNMKELPESVSCSKRDYRIPLILSVKVDKHVSHPFESSMDCVMGGYYYEDVGDKDMKVIAYEQESNRPLLVQIAIGDGTAFLSQIRLEINGALFEKLNPDASHAFRLQKSDVYREQLFKSLLEDLQLNCASTVIPSLTPFYLISRGQSKEKFIQALDLTTEKRRFEGKECALDFVMEQDDVPGIQEMQLPIIINSSTSVQDQFDDDIYFSNLQAKELGQIVLYSDVVTSTQHILEGNPQFTQSIPEDTGVVVVCKQQVKGKGRSGNAWLSPLGCMMFSLMVRLKVNSELGTRLPYLQHIASLAVVEAVRSLDGYEDINIRLKWPNDIYYGRSVKLGGVIVSSSIINNSFTAIIGMGVNLSNYQPTVCINEVIQECNRQHGTCLEPLSTELLLARTVSNIEQLFADFQAYGTGSFLKKYYKRWLHSNAQVTVSGDSPEVVTINGLDQFGFLSVKRESGEIYSVQPDGNSFDMLRNLILMKQRNL